MKLEAGAPAAPGTRKTRTVNTSRTTGWNTSLRRAYSSIPLRLQLDVVRTPPVDAFAL